MARIDRLVQAMFQASADRLIMASGERLILVVEDEHRPVSPQPVTVAQIRDLLKEIVPPELARDVEQDGEHEFCYPAPAGTVTVKVSRDGKALRLEAGPLPLTDAPDPAPGQASEGRRATLTIESLFVQMVREHCSDLPRDPRRGAVPLQSVPGPARHGGRVPDHPDRHQVGP